MVLSAQRLKVRQHVTPAIASSLAMVHMRRRVAAQHAATVIALKRLLP
jgi:hypothetical protein